MAFAEALSKAVKCDATLRPAKLGYAWKQAYT